MKTGIDSGLIKTVDYADTRGVPFFLKGMVRGKFPKEEESYILLDWKGKLAKAYDFEEKKCNILVFDVGGSLPVQDFGYNC
ncbi:MAG: hypothetical protein ACE5FH_05120 [Candidatus Zixiibacteriota bacterium]